MMANRHENSENLTVRHSKLAAIHSADQQIKKSSNAEFDTADPQYFRENCRNKVVLSKHEPHVNACPLHPSAW